MDVRGMKMDKFGVTKDYKISIGRYTRIDSLFILLQDP